MLGDYMISITTLLELIKWTTLIPMSLGREKRATVKIRCKKASNAELQAWFDEVLPNWDRDRVYPSDIRKLIQWYNILINAGITDFTIEEEEA